MTLLDRFRSQIARQKHTDPAVRLAFVEEVPLDEREVIASIAREDEDPRVRRAAVAKLMDPAALGRIAGEDPDEDVREQAGVMLRDIALEAFEGVAEGDSLEAVEAIGDSRALAHVARSAVREIVAIRALSRVADARLVGAIARHAACEGARKGAVQMLVERAEHAELLAVAMNSEYKDTALAAMDQITDQAELEQIAAGGRNKGAVKRARGVLREAGEQAGREAAAAADMAQGVAPAEQALAENVRRLAEPPLEHAAHDEAERLDSERAQDEAAALDADLRRARALEDAAARQREEAARLEAERARALEDAAAREREREREAAAREADARVRREALVRLQQLVARIEPLPAKDGLTLKAADRALHDIREALASVPPLPTRQDYHDVTHRLKSVLEALTPRALELREADEWQRWANVNVQEQLIVRMEALRGAEDPEETITRVRELQQQWKEAADVPRAKADLLWRRFKAAHDEVWAGCEAHFARQAQVRAENLARKIALCEKAETLAESASWLQTADEIKRLQAEWKTIGPVPRGQEKAIWDRFRAPCDRFFIRRNEDLARRKAQWSENLGRKDALCARAEALAESSDWEAAAAGIRQVQAEWKAIGPVKKSKSEAIWRRFRAACDGSSPAMPSATRSRAPSASRPARRSAPSSKR